MSPHPNRIPPIGRMLWRGVRVGCPACGALALRPPPVITAPTCERCGLRFERIEGHFIGAIGINTILSFVILLFSLGLSMILTFPNFPIEVLFWNGAVALVVPLVLLPISRTLWTAIDIAMRPLEPHEVDWSEVYASVGRDLADGE